MTLTAAIVLVVGEALSWGDGWAYEFYTSRIFNILLGLFFGAIVFSLPKMRVVFSTLLTMSSEIAEDEAEERLMERVAKVSHAVDRFPTKEKFGELFEAKVVSKSD
jgi:hypothetical protein